MAVRIINRSMDIPIPERTIGYIGDNRVETRAFELNRFYGDIDLSEFDFKLDTEINGTKNIIDLDKSVTVDKITLTWTVRESHILHPGRMSIQIRAFKGDVEKWHSAQDYVLVQSSINATEAIPDPLPSEFEQMETRITAIQTDVTEKANEVEADRAEVAGNTATVIEKAGQAEQYAAAALASEQKAKVSEDNAKDSETEAERQAGIAANNILNGVATHNASEESHPHILGELVSIEAIARGRASSLTFDTEQQLIDWIAGDYERPDGKTVDDLNVGDNLYILDIDVPDYWWTGTDISELEAQAVNLGDYYTKTEVDARLPIVIEQSDYDGLVDSGQVIAGRIYYVVPDGTLGGGDGE